MKASKQAPKIHQPLGMKGKDLEPCPWLSFEIPHKGRELFLVSLLENEMWPMVTKCALWSYFIVHQLMRFYFISGLNYFKLQELMIKRILATIPSPQVR